MIARQVQRLPENRQQLPRLGGRTVVTVPVQLRDYFELASDAFLGFTGVALGLNKRRSAHQWSESNRDRSRLAGRYFDAGPHSGWGNLL
jgi:hypothetical protein